MTIVSLDQLKALFSNVGAAITGLPGSCIRPAYQTDSPPTWEQSQDIIYFHISRESWQGSQFVETSYSPNSPEIVNQSIFFTELLIVDWTAYGAHAFDNLRLIKPMILTDLIRSLMAPYHIFPIPDEESPSRLPFQFNNQNWERSDLRTTFNCGSTITSVVPTISEVVVEILTDETPPNKLDKTITITT